MMIWYPNAHLPNVPVQGYLRHLDYIAETKTRGWGNGGHMLMPLLRKTPLLRSKLSRRKFSDRYQISVTGKVPCNGGPWSFSLLVAR